MLGGSGHGGPPAFRSFVEGHSTQISTPVGESSFARRPDHSGRKEIGSADKNWHLLGPKRPTRTGLQNVPYSRKANQRSHPHQSLSGSHP